MVEPTTRATGPGADAPDAGAADDGGAGSGSSRLISATAIMAAGTAMSRVLGFAKAAMLGVALGYGTRQADMFGFANVVPQAIYLLLAGGVLNTVFVPQIVRAMQEDADGGEAFTNRLITLGMSAIGIIAILATVGAPVIMRVYLDGQWLAPELSGQLSSIVMLAYLCLPQIFFYGVTVMLGQVLNARGKFGPMMWAPVLNNLVGISSIGLFLILWPGRRDLGAPFTVHQELVLGLGATVGILAQSLVLIPFIRAVGFRFRPRFDFRNSGLGRAGKVAKWTVGYMIVTQLALVVVSRLASSAVPSGHGAGWTVYQNANLIFMLPHSLITVSLVTAMLPSTSRLVLSGDRAGARDEVIRTMRLTVTALLPASVAFLALGFPIVAVLFGHGNGSGQSGLIGWTLVAFAIGLVPFTLQYVCLRAFYALEDTRTTFFVQILIAGVNVAAALLLVLPIGRPNWVAPGLALAYASAYVVGLGVSFRQLGKQLPGLHGGEIVRHCVRVFLAVLPAGAAAYGITRLFALWSTGFGAQLLALAVAGVVAVGIYLGLARVLHISEVNQIVRTVLRRGGRRTAPEGPSEGRTAVSSPSVGGSDPEGFASSGTIGDGTQDAAATLGSTDNANNDDGQDDDAGSDNADEASIVTRIRRQNNHPAGQQMTGGQSDQPHLAEAGAAVPPPPVTGPAADLDETDSERTASFTLAELESAGTGTDDTEQFDSEPAASDLTEPVPDHLPAGTVLADRYRLEELLAWAGASITWRAFDQVLSRSVVIHLLPFGDERSDGLLAAGRQASGATDSRFLRVLDAVEEGAIAADGQTVGSYIVSEYAEGQSLQSVLVAAPLTGLESAWVVREVADALSGAHGRGLHHRRLNPETVVITPAGNIKIVGLLIEAALRPSEYASAPTSDDALTDADVTDLGRLLYACLVARWPGDAAYGLAAAPPAPGPSQDSGHPWLTPRQVRHGVSPTLDRICDQLLSPIPRQRAPRIVTAAELVGELDRVLGSADATSDLERRLRHPQPRFLGEDPDTGRIPLGVVSEPYALVERNGSIAAGTNSGTEAGTPASPDRPTGVAAPPPEPDKPRPGPGRWIWLVVILALVVAVVLTVLTARGLGPAANLVPKDEQSSAAPPAAQPIKIVDGLDFDPPPGNGSEHPGEVKKAYDGDPKTRWTTMSYFGSPDLGNLKPGVGIVLDLGSVQKIGSVKLQLSGDGTDVQIRVPKGERGAEPDMNSLKSWRTVARQKDIAESGTCTVEKQVETRYVLVFLTSLPEEGGNYRGGINEVEVVS